jgi:hypothetical protein
MLTVHDYTFEVTSSGWPSHHQAAVDRILVALALEILRLDKAAARQLHKQAKARAALEQRAMTQAQEAVANIRKPKPPLPSPNLKPGFRPPNRPKPPPPEAKPIIQVIAR